jgi:hypothetical protein
LQRARDVEPLGALHGSQQRPPAGPGNGVLVHDDLAQHVVFQQRIRQHERAWRTISTLNFVIRTGVI